MDVRHRSHIGHDTPSLADAAILNQGTINYHQRMTTNDNSKVNGPDNASLALGMFYYHHLFFFTY